MYVNCTSSTPSDSRKGLNKKDGRGEVRSLMVLSATLLSVFSGRYLFLNAIANQLRYPNSHTHYFSCVLLYLFAEANTEAIQEQITR